VVFNVVPGFGEEAGKALALHPEVDLVTFTGSTEVARLMLRYAGESNLKRVALECGGKTPQVVFADADLASAAVDIAWGIYYNSGETCHAGSRLVVHQSVKDALLEALRRVTATITLGHPLEASTQMGALIDEKHMRRVLGYIEGGVAAGARLALGGHRALEHTGGFYVEATVLDAVHPRMRVAQEEIFGPVASLIPFDDEDDAIRIANDSDYGLSAAVTSGSEERARAVANRLRVGSVTINGGIWHGPDAPFGGYKASGVGRQNGLEGLEEYLETKTLTAPAAE
jgi:acyl-CoA reductase-like NAD-dependent aldehyde dehydrogenase